MTNRNKKRNIFFIDDENNRTLRWREHLTTTFEVIYFSKPIPLQDMQDRIIADAPVAIIQDIMMQRGSDGTIDIGVGLEVAKNMKDFLVKLRIPFILFSNRMLREFESEIKALNYPENILYFKSKPDTGYEQLTIFVRSILI